MKVSVVSGHFSPLHGGHLDYFNYAKNDGDYLVVIVNNDLQVKLKGSSHFMDEQHRLEIIKSLRVVDNAIIAIDKNSSVCQTLADIAFLYPTDKLTFYNSGDRDPNNINPKEEEICKILNIETKFLDLPKRYSSRDFRKGV